MSLAVSTVVNGKAEAVEKHSRASFCRRLEAAYQLGSEIAFTYGVVPTKNSFLFFFVCGGNECKLAPRDSLRELLNEHLTLFFLIKNVFFFLRFVAAYIGIHSFIN